MRASPTSAGSRSPRCPETAPNSIQFWSVSVGDNAAAVGLRGKKLGVKSVAIMYFNNAQGASLLPQIKPVFEGSRHHHDQGHPAVADLADPSPQAALVESSGAQLVYVDIPNGCAEVLKALKSVGYSGKIMGIDPCGAPPVIAAAAGGANGMYIASPFILQTGGTTAGPAVPRGAGEVGRAGHVRRLDLDGRVRDGDQRPQTLSKIAGR